MNTDKITEALADAARCPQCPGCNAPWHVCPACGRRVYH